MTKSELTAFLKTKFDLSRVRVDRGSGPEGKGKAIKRDGSFVQGIYCWSHSPMDMTNVGATKAADKYAEVSRVVRNIEGARCDYADGEMLTITLNAGTKQQFVARFRRERFPSYSLARNMDPGYQSTWIAVRYSKD
uniref:Uncharacterized protein n=1 Tax=Pseudomonas phage Cygsa01 TaxID=3138529 RepID=A0AAU6W466_9VIRU